MKPGSLASRLSALALLFVVLALGYALIVEPALARFSADRETAAVLQRVLAEYQRGDSGAIGQAANVGPIFLPGDSEGQANAALQEKAKALVGVAGAALTSVQALPTEEKDGVQRIPVRVKLTADTAGVLALLYALETERPMLLVDNVTINARNTQAVGAGRNLDVQLDVVGFRPMPGGTR